MIKHLNTQKTAVKINANDEFNGVNEEYKTIDEIFHEGWNLLLQSVSVDTYTAYDVLLLKNSEGKFFEIWFDISAFYGK